jgi:succinoglycan biosynthesis transport protein ExoP
MTLRQLLLAIHARWALTLGIFCAVVFTAVLMGLLSPRLYTASATVVVDAKADPVAAAGYATPMSTGYIATQVDIISSERVAQRVAKLLKLDQSPESIKQWRDSTGGQGDVAVWLGSKLQKTLSVTPSRDSSVIEISVTWTDPTNAAIIANAFADAYIDTNIELKVEPAKQYAVWFDERSRALRADLEAKQKRLGDFQAQTGIVATDGRLDIENARLSELSSQLVSVQALRQESASRQRQINGDPESMAEVLQSPVIGSLKGELSRAEAKLHDIATNLGKNHPDYQNTAAEIAGLKSRIADESARIAASLGNNTQVMLRRENDIRAALEAQKKRMLDLTNEHDRVSVLQNDVTTAQRNLDAVTQRLAQSSLESQMEQTNIVLLTKAVPPLFRSSPRLSLNLLMGIMLGGILSVGSAIFLELRDRRVREGAELPELLGVPLFGKIPHIRPDARNFRASPAKLGRVEPSAI